MAFSLILILQVSLLPALRCQLVNTCRQLCETGLPIDTYAHLQLPAEPPTPLVPPLFNY
jgi:hypothetical protein